MILDDIASAVTEGNTAKVISLMPALMDAYNSGWIVELPCMVVAGRGGKYMPVKALNKAD